MIEKNAHGADRYLLSSEIVALKTALSRWQTPDAMYGLVNDAMEKIGSKAVFNQGGLAFLRDGWIAARFGKARDAASVRLVDEEWPDFEVLVEGTAYRYEATEADDPMRRRGEEYKQRVGVVEDDPIENWIERADMAPDWLVQACDRKVKKKYGGTVGLVIYLNLSEYGIRTDQVRSSFHSATETAKNSFDEVWVLWKGTAYRVWSGGNACSL